MSPSACPVSTRVYTSKHVSLNIDDVIILFFIAGGDYIFEVTLFKGKCGLGMNLFGGGSDDSKYSHLMLLFIYFYLISKRKS